MYLGIDVGTQSLKVLLYDAQQGMVVDVQSAPLDMISDNQGTREQLSHWWIDALEQCLLKLDVGHREAIKAIGVSGQQHGFVALDASGEVLAPVKLWCDTATTEECAQITAAFGGEQRCIDELGNPILPGYTAPKIGWLKNKLPDAYARLATVLLPHDYINFFLTGERVMECGDASGTGLLDVRARCWHHGMLDALDPGRDLAKVLPPLAEPDTVIGQLRTQIADKLGLPRGIPVAAGGGDNMMAAIGTGNVASGRLTVSLGTSGTLFAYSDTPIVDPQGGLAAFCSSTGGWLPLICTMNCTVSTELGRSLFDLELAELEARISSAPAGANGVVTLPFFNGERTPNLPNGKGCILGLDENNYTPNNLLRSAMESAVFGLRAGLDTLRNNGCAIESIRLTGGGAGSAVWRQMVADIFALPVSVQAVDEGAALGAALQALWMHQRQQGDTRPLAALVDEHLTLDPQRGCQPEAEAVCTYTEHYGHYQRHVEAISALYR